jgi:signal transduction histidine kinase
VSSIAASRERVLRVDVRVWDSLLVALLLAISILPLRFGTSPGDGSRAVEPLTYLLTLGAIVPLWWWRRAPLAVLVVVAACAGVYGALGYPMSPVLPLMLAGYGAAARRPRSDRQTAAFVAAALASFAIQFGPHLNWLNGLIGTFFTVVVPIAIGRIVWNRRLRLERERELAAQDAVAAERARIARELHDVVAHSIGVMVVQAGAARAVLRERPDDAERALRTIEEAGRTGLTEMRRLLDATPADGPALAPQPGLADLDELLERVRATGVPVEALTTGVPRELPPGVDLSAYRIVQEALTNTLKHGGRGAHARVVIDYGDDHVAVEVDDDGRNGSTSVGIGHGLIGMRERVAMFSGTLETGARPGGGFRVRATFPLGRAT